MKQEKSLYEDKKVQKLLKDIKEANKDPKFRMAIKEPSTNAQESDGQIRDLLRKYVRYYDDTMERQQIDEMNTIVNKGERVNVPVH